MEYSPDLFLIYQIGLIIILATLASELVKKAKLPGLLGAIFVGLFFGGPGSFGLLSETPEIKLLGSLGAILLLFVVGLQFDADLFFKMGKKAFFLTTIGVVCSVVIGYYMGIFFGLTTQAALLLAVMISPSGTSVISAILIQYDIIKTDEGSTIVAAAVIDDVEGIILVSILSSTIQHETISFMNLFFNIILTICFVVGSIYLGNKIIPKIINKVEKHITDEILFILFLGFGLILAFIGAYFFNLAAITGAFIVGAIIPYQPIAQKFDLRLGLMKDVLVTLFFTSIGIAINPLHILPIIPFALIILTIAIGARLIGGIIGGYMGKARGKLLWTAAFGLSIRGEMSLIIAEEGISRGIVGEEFMILTFLIILGSILILFPIFIRLTKNLENNSINNQTQHS